jgi:exopolysaccharide biosynthesis polyprenyl glycosylphosphotransferase
VTGGSCPHPRVPAGAGRVKGGRAGGPVRLRAPAAALVRKAALPAADAVGLAAAIAVSGAGRTPFPAAVYAAAVFAVLAASRLHRLRVCLRVSDQAGHLFAAAAVPLPVLLAWQAIAPRPLAWLALGTAVFVLSARLAVCAVLCAAHRRGWLTEQAVVVGAGTFGGFLAGLMLEHPELGLHPAGFIDDGPPRRDLPVPALGTTDDLAGVITDGGISRVIVCFSSDCRDEDLVAVLRACRLLVTDICVAPRFYELGMAVPRHCLDEIWGIPLIPLRPPPRAGLAVKRATDIAVGLIGGLLAAPFVLMLAAVIRISSGTPALFRQTRVTGKETVTTIMKLRTLPVPRDQDAPGADTQWRADEERCGPFSRWLRATHLDELPQLVNVLRGEMSLVGPRPERPQFAQQFCRDIPRYADRTRMPGGLTGWAQVNGLNGDTSVFDRARFDNYYAEYWSPWLDAVILMRTAVQVGHAALGRT